ncbi:hypothetical protein B0I73DRAFT_131019 [Yarrowia lipolytica]|uniref:Uncharacterized protein n=1 Tax=Yarrowia lipolytica TaxID=4952 RepID=A0A371C0J7_YARLL|nr:hypothetical protein BKA91DRAFT_138348 [Yarrowia lipolytica]KAE8173237.1 hypothetical protein BKA90DRAFT_136134 [Yarrowia lipolytica]RDW23622.1 hypothetical protein B0I71DRAFT_135627 [Yarrowia lipolytica]RDW40073.1 hypothetical protein B0I73DRAFT_131019 [Yarrowia lipolytica]RMI96833.1 hypothetical protein BD777DRAFT_128188 [Yarrowia lipolytica]
MRQACQVAKRNEMARLNGIVLWLSSFTQVQARAQEFTSHSTVYSGLCACGDIAMSNFDANHHLPKSAPMT